MAFGKSLLYRPDFSKCNVSTAFRETTQWSDETAGKQRGGNMWWLPVCGLLRMTAIETDRKHLGVAYERSICADEVMPK